MVFETCVIPNFERAEPRRGLTLVENGIFDLDGPRRGLTLVNLIRENIYVVHLPMLDLYEVCCKIRDYLCSYPRFALKTA